MNTGLPENRVQFYTENEDLQRLYDRLLEKCAGNLADFGGDRVLVEGGGYQKIWLETQPMGGENFAAWDQTAALNNQELFMRHQRADGRLPGSIACGADGKVIPQYDKFQGFCFPEPALNMYYLTGRDEGYLRRLENCLRRMDAYLWQWRDSNGDGILESFCVYDTGEDAALRYGDAPNYWTEDGAPAEFASVPLGSMDVTSWSCAARETLADIHAILGTGEADSWRQRAEQVRRRIREKLWDEEIGACFDLGPDGKRKPELIHNTLRCMYWGSLSPDMAEAFVKKHLLNPREFWTRMPLPSVAVSDPLFRNAPENNWSGQSEGLTWQRAIPALERYGYEKIVTRMAGIFLEAMKENGYRFVQQYDPLTGKASLVRSDTHKAVGPEDTGEVQDGYGPTMLACLTMMAHTTGVDLKRGQVWYSAVRGTPFTWERAWDQHRYRAESDGSRFRCMADGRVIAEEDCGKRVIADERGRILRVLEIEPIK